MELPDEGLSLSGGKLPGGRDDIAVLAAVVHPRVGLVVRDHRAGPQGLGDTQTKWV